MSKPKNKLFIVKKYVMATSVINACKKERSQSPDDVWVDEDWKKGNNDNLASAIGFSVEDDE